MSSDDVTRNLTNNDGADGTTQPTITAVFRLLREVQDGQTGLSSRLGEVEKGLSSRIDELEKGLSSRIDALESRLARDFASVDTRLAEMSDQMKSGFLHLADKIERSRLHAEADYHDLLRRIRELESKAS